MKTYSMTRINSGEKYSIELSTDQLNINSSRGSSAFHYHCENNKINVEVARDLLTKEAQEVALEFLFGTDSAVTEITINNHEKIARENFFEQDGIWNAPTKNMGSPEKIVTTGTVSHPMRPEFHAGQVLYRRFVENINSSLEYRVIDINKDLDTFHNWHNQPRVADFWELAKSKEELKDYIEKGLKDPHQIPVMVEINGIPAAYFEIYWTKEDRLGPYYDSENYDRGFHLLVGNPDSLGFKNTDAILKCATHFIFLDDSRTMRIMGEPRHDNEKILKYILTFKSWRKIKEFDFPHKRAALLECDRKLFFQGHYL
jgi:acetyl CoA:N6-hydroxylysine acetyl transferase